MKRTDQAVKIDGQIAMMLRVIVEAENLDRDSDGKTSLAEILSDIARGPVEKRYGPAIEKLRTAGHKKGK